MSVEKKLCPDCHTKLEIITLPELVSAKREANLDAAFKLIGNVFNRFTFYVCPNCGRTLVYAVPEIRKLAAEESDEIIGIS